MTYKTLPAVLLLAALPMFALAEEPVPAAVPAPAVAAPAPDTAAALVAPADTPAAAQIDPAADPSADPTADPAAGPGDASAPPTGKRVCNMKGKGMMSGPGMMGGPGMGPGKGCGCPGHHGNCGYGTMHQDLVQRLDLIEARLAKIEAMLEGLMRR